MHWKAIMTDSLRDRIAAVLGDNTDHSHRYDLADAVIRELDDMGIIHLSKVRHDE